MMPHEYESDSEILEYEVEQTEPAALSTVPVCVKEPVTTVETVPQHAATSTIVLTSGQPIAQLLPQDPLRLHAEIFPIDNQIIICHSWPQASDAIDVTADPATPNGLLVLPGREDLIETGVTTAFTAGSAGSAFLPAGTLYLTGWDVTIAAPSAGTPAGTVTVAGVASSGTGNYIYNLTDTTGENFLSRSYPGKGLPILAGSSGGVLVSAITNGGAGNISVFGLTTGATQVSTGRRILLDTTQEMFVAANIYPTRVGVIVTRRSP